MLFLLSSITLVDIGGNDMIFYFYKITNTINGKYYYGVHKTTNINDGYMGSGRALTNAYKKYGKSNFVKNILKYFNNEDEMYEYEKTIVDNSLVKNEMCYNLVVGGRNAIIYARKIYKKVSKKTRLKQSEAQKNRWSNASDEYRAEFGKKVSSSQKYKEYIHRVKIEGKNKGYKNFDFINRWKDVYDKDSELICYLMNHTNIPDAVIIRDMFNKKVKIDRLINYYISIKMLGEIEEVNTVCFYCDKRDSTRGYKKTNLNKTRFRSSSTNRNVMFYIKEFFDKFDELIRIEEDNSISDSMVIQGNNKLPFYNQMIEYFEELGLIKDVCKVKVYVDRAGRDSKFKIPSTKTKFTVNNSFNTILIDKEMIEYGINEHGKPFQKGRVELRGNGNK